MSDSFEAHCEGGGVRIELQRFDALPKLTTQRIRNGFGTGAKKTVLGSVSMIQDIVRQVDARRRLETVVPQKLFSAISACQHACNGEHGGCKLQAEIGGRRTLFKRQV